MDEDDPWSALAQKAQLLQTLIAPLSSSTSKLSHKSRAVPHDKDFHFYNNFPDFKLPAKEILSVTHSSLDSLSSSSNFFGSKTQPPFPSDPDESYDWLVNLNDDLVERFNLSLDEFKAAREKAEGKGGSLELEEGGFQVVNNRRKKKGSLMEESQKDEVKVGLKEKKALGVKSKVPFHIPTIRRPQDEFNILVNNVNKPFEHVWLEKSEDGSRFVHPLEKLSISDFIDRSIQKDEIVKPLPIETTPFKLVEAVKDLKELAAKLLDVNEFAVDLEHNQYRSFQGLTCLMQISTRTEDFIIDTLKLRVHIGPYLREVFRDPSKRKVMHGADRDIEWLQRDFGIYICNLFDTGQASRVMQLERNSLEFLLHHFCEVSANKEYQNADWRLRPLPDEMLKYAREDTHYLLYIYDVMRSRLLLSSSDEEDLLLEVYKRSYDVCIHLYEKELLTDTSFLHLYGRLQEADFNSRQLAVADGLYKWRDRVARDEDESTGYILPNKTLLEIAKQMPVSHGKLRWLVKSKHTAVDQHLNNVIMIIKRAIEKSSDYEGLVEQLKARLEEKAMQKLESGNNSQIVLDTEEPIDAIKDAMDDVQLDGDKNSSGQITSGGPQQMDKTSPMSLDIGFSPEVSHSSGTVEEKRMDNGRSNLSLLSNKASTASVQIMKKQTCAFGALLGNSASRRKSNPSIGYNNEQDKNVNKVEQIRSKVTLPFHSFSGEHNNSEPNPPEIIKQADPETHPQHSSPQSFPTELEEVIKLENNESDTTQSSAESPDDGEIDTKEESTSLSNISSSFEECFQSISQIKGRRNKNKRQSQEEPEVNIQVKPFDYATARINFNFGEGGVNNKTDSDSREGKGSASRRANREEKVRGLRRQAFPPTGNRSATYK